MANITEKYDEPLESLDGKKFDNELDFIKHAHGFEPRQVKNSHMTQEEIDSRWLSRNKSKVNHAR